MLFEIYQAEYLSCLQCTFIPTFSCPPDQWKIVKVLSVDNPRIEYARPYNDHWNIDRAT